MLYFPDLYGFATRINPEAAPEAAKKAAGITALVFILEDIPQLVSNRNAILDLTYFPKQPTHVQCLMHILQRHPRHVPLGADMCL